MELVADRLLSVRHGAQRCVWEPPFRQCVEWFVLRLCDDGHLIAPHRVDQTTTLDNCLRTNEDEIDFIHDVSDRGIKHHRARDAGCGQDIVGLEAIKTWVSSGVERGSLRTRGRGAELR